MLARSARSPKSYSADKFYSADKPCSAERHRNGRLACHQKPSCILCISTHWLCFAETLDSYLPRRRRIHAQVIHSQVIHSQVIRWLCFAKIVTDILTKHSRRRLRTL